MTSHPNTDLRMQRIPENVGLIWIDGRIDRKDPYFQKAIDVLGFVTKNVNLRTKIDDCVQFLNESPFERFVVISSGSLGLDLVKQIDSMEQIDSIYLFCAAVDHHATWAKDWPKIRGVHNSLIPICQSIQKNFENDKDEDDPITILTKLQDGANIVEKQLEPSFMYTKILKKIFLEMQDDDRELREKVVRYAFNRYRDDRKEIDSIEDFDKNYEANKAIIWYVKECFLYKMLNQALRLLKVDVLVLLGFFIRDLHFQIVDLHRRQIRHFNGKKFDGYRGQYLSERALEKLANSHGGLISFNNFLSISRKRHSAEKFISKDDLEEKSVRVIFVMKIDPKQTSAVFADISHISQYPDEEEILFCMNTVFRIGAVKMLKNKKKLFEVHLSLSSDDDKDLNALTVQIEKEIRGETPWKRLGKLLIKLGEVKKAEELYETLVKQNNSKEDEAFYLHQLGWIKDDQEDWQTALKYYHEALKIEEEIFPKTDPSLATSYNNIGLVYANLTEYDKALFYHKKALAIEEKNISKSDVSSAATYNNIGTVYVRMKNYPDALKCFERTCSIEEKQLDKNNPSLAITYNNIAAVHQYMTNHLEALRFYQKALEVKRKSLPANHHSLATAYSNIGSAYQNLEKYVEARTAYEQAYQIQIAKYSKDHLDVMKLIKVIDALKTLS